MGWTPEQYAALRADLKPGSYAPATGIAPPPAKVRTFPHPPSPRPAPRKPTTEGATIAPVAAGSLLFFAVLKAAGLPLPVSEFKFHNARKWRFDHAWPEQRLALEIDGGLFINGSHNRGARILKTHEKENAAAASGWRLIHCQPSNLHKPETISTIRAALGFPI